MLRLLHRQGLRSLIFFCFATLLQLPQTSFAYRLLVVKEVLAPEMLQKLGKEDAPKCEAEIQSLNQNIQSSVNAFWKGAASIEFIEWSQIPKSTADETYVLRSDIATTYFSSASEWRAFRKFREKYAQTESRSREVKLRTAKLVLYKMVAPEQKIFMTADLSFSWPSSGMLCLGINSLYRHFQFRQEGKNDRMLLVESEERARKLKAIKLFVPASVLDADLKESFSSHYRFPYELCSDAIWENQACKPLAGTAILVSVPLSDGAYRFEVIADNGELITSATRRATDQYEDDDISYLLSLNELKQILHYLE
jgi:hypothetical protein